MPSADTHTLRLKNELFDLRVGVCEPDSASLLARRAEFKS